MATKEFVEICAASDKERLLKASANECLKPFSTGTVNLCSHEFREASNA